MKFLKKIKDNITTEYKLFNIIPLFKKEKFLSCNAYYLFNYLYFKKKRFADGYELHLFGQKILKKRLDVINRIKPHAKGKDFIYFCMHSGDFYYLCSLIKNNFEKYKDTVIITNFKYARLVFEQLDFNKEWLNEYFVVVPNLWLWSLCLWCKADGTVISKAQIDHQFGWFINDKIQKNKEYFTIADNIKDFLKEDNFKHAITPIKAEKNNTVLLIPESQFNGNLDFNALSILIEKLTLNGYKVAINTKSNKYDKYLNENVYKIFLNYKETFEFASKCDAIISVRNGLMDCLQNVIKNDVKIFVFYNKWHYPHYNHFKCFYDWFKAVYSFNKINSTNNYNEYFYEKDYELLAEDIINKILKE